MLRDPRSSTAWIDVLQGRGIDLSLFSAQSAGVPVIEAFVWEALEGELKEGNESVRRMFHDRPTRVARSTEGRPVTWQSSQMRPNAKHSGPTPKDTDQATSSRDSQQASDRLREASPAAGAAN